MRRLESILAGAVAFAVYAPLCASVSGMGDSSELTLALATGGVAHPTGYPLYLGFGHAFCVVLHALGASWSLAANLWSAVGAAVAIGALHALATQLAGVTPESGSWWRRLTVALPIALFAFSPILMKEAISAEVNSWALAWVCVAGYLFIRVFDTAASAAEPTPGRARRDAALWGLCCGAGLAHHLTSVWISAPLSLALLTALVRRRRLVPGLILSAIGAALVAFASYAVVAWRAWHPVEGQWAGLMPSWASVWEHITGERYRRFLGYFAPSPSQREQLAVFGYPFLFPGLAFLLVGAVRAASRERRIAWFALSAAAFLSTGFTFFYGVPDPASYFLPGIALGMAAAGPALAGFARAGSPAWRIGVAIAGLAGLAFVVYCVRDGIEYRQGLMLYDRMMRVGLDPLAGIAASSIPEWTPGERTARDRFINGLGERMNARTPVPVILFDPSVPIVRQMPKPWERAGR